MKEKKERELSVLRMLASAIKNKEIEKRSSGKSTMLDDEEVVAAIRSEIKKRKDAAELFSKGGRGDLAEKELYEQTVLTKYLPQEMTDEEIEKAVNNAIDFTGTRDPKNFGRIMGETMKRIKGRASGDRVSAWVKGKLLRSSE
ncbi:MAG: GatB/YqeY domain-containing protein [Candidatus Colwellbacteria bacterium]|nr:GatB/YqeY domain-containing protein [Candidatus Colwellbacteria bacterium]